MNIDHTLAIVIAIGMIILLVMAIILTIVLLTIAFGIRRLARNLEQATTKLKYAIDNPLELVGELLRGAGACDGLVAARPAAGPKLEFSAPCKS